MFVIVYSCILVGSTDCSLDTYDDDKWLTMCRLGLHHSNSSVCFGLIGAALLFLAIGTVGLGVGVLFNGLLILFGLEMSSLDIYWLVESLVGE